jgi:hypothetical protein
VWGWTKSVERPELLVATLLCPYLQPGEAVKISGAERFCRMVLPPPQPSHSGVPRGGGLRFGRREEDQAPRSEDDGSVQTCFALIDPIDACGSLERWPLLSQLRPPHLLREVNKAYAAFKPSTKDERREYRMVSTSSDDWGCGAHLTGWGHLELRLVLQWLAASEAKRPLRCFIRQQDTVTGAQQLALGKRLRDFAEGLTRPRQARASFLQTRPLLCEMDV